MLRRSHILTAVAVLVAFAAFVPSAYAIYPAGAFAGDGKSPPPPPPSSIAQSADQAYQDLRSPDARDAGQSAQTQVTQDLRSPDARDAKTEPVTQVAQDLRSPDARDAAQAAKVEIAQDLRSPDARDAGLPEAPTPDTVVEIREVPGSGFDWGDAGIGAGSSLALVLIGVGSVLAVRHRPERSALAS